MDTNGMFAGGGANRSEKAATSGGNGGLGIVIARFGPTYPLLIGIYDRNIL